MGFYTGDHHKDVRKSEVKRSQDNVRKTVDAFENFLNPFSVEKDKLDCVASAAAVPSEIEKDLLEAEKKGREARMEFVDERLKKGEKIFEPIHKQKLNTMANMKKSVKLKATQNKLIELQQQGNIITKLLVKSQEENLKYDMAELMKYCLTPILLVPLMAFL